MCLLVISLTSAPCILPIKKQPIHRLGKNVPFSHVKPPDGVPHWTLDQVHLRFDIKSSSQSSTSGLDLMLLENSTLLEDQVNMDPASSAETSNTEQIIGIIDVALRLALTNLPPRALSGIKVIERFSFKHLDDICPAMWSPDHIEVLWTLVVAICCACTDSIFNRLLLHERSSYPLSAMSSRTLSHSERTLSH
jgi:hypothetical protein